MGTCFVSPPPRRLPKLLLINCGKLTFFSILLQFKSRDSGISLYNNNKVLDCTTTDQFANNGIVSANVHKNGDASNGSAASKSTPYATSANGSIITMTLKNNHLIVETEERSVRMSIKSFMKLFDLNKSLSSTASFSFFLRFGYSHKNLHYFTSSP